MAEAPTGTITFLFTDIEGSTKLWEQHPDAMRQAVARHEAILHDATDAHEGYVFKKVGDAFCVAFARATDGLATALEAQRALQAEPWAIGPLRVRMALYTGEAEERGGDYFGPPLNRCARILSAGHGGQVLLAQGAAEVVRDLLPEGAGLTALGQHRLRDLTRPEDLYQLTRPDLPSDFPPLRSLQAFAHNLPTQLTSFIGREEEMEEVKRLLGTTHLLTLTGTGGAGKTRLALQVGADLLDEYPDGVWLVELAALSEPSLVPQAALSALGLREEPQRALTDTLTDALRPKALLLILDNCEHLVGACAALSDRLLRACPQVRVVATSREALRAEGESVWRVPSLASPEPELGGGPLAERLTQYSAARLFVERALAASPGFRVTAGNAPAIAELCRRLDGVPLALELAAARASVLSAEQILERLGDRFRLLTGGRRTALPRQQTLRAAVEWSYDLLRDAERRLFTRMSVFASGFTLEAAEAVGVGGEVGAGGVLDLLTELVHKSLVVVRDQGSGGRYHILETLRAYGMEHAAEHGDPEQLHRRHAEFFLDFAERARPELLGPNQVAWFRRVENDHDNLRTALAWGLRADTDLALRLANALAGFWDLRCHWSEAQQWFAQCLDRSPDAAPTLRSAALGSAGLLACRRGDYEQAEALSEEALCLSGEVGLELVAAAALNTLAMVAQRRGDYATARVRFDEAIGLRRRVGDEAGAARALANLGLAADERGDVATARACYEEALEVSRRLGDRSATANTLANLALLVQQTGDLDAAMGLQEESLGLLRDLGNRMGIGVVLGNLGLIAEAQGELNRARALHAEALATLEQVGAGRDIAVSLRNLAGVVQEQGALGEADALYHRALEAAVQAGDKRVATGCLEGLATLRSQEGRAERAARLFGAAEAQRAFLGLSLVSLGHELYERHVDAARAALREEAFQAAWDAGKAMSLEEVVEYALAEVDDG